MRKGAHLRTQYFSLKLGNGRFCAPKFWLLLNNCAPNFEQVLSPLWNNSKPISLSDFLMETSKSSKNTVSSKLRSGFIAVFSASNSCQRHRHESRDLPPSSSANTNYSYYILSSAHAPFISIQPPPSPSTHCEI